VKAITYQRYGDPEVLSLNDILPPTLGADDVLVRVAAAGLDPGVWHLMAGRPFVVRLATGLRRPRSTVLGGDLAGRIEAVGADVTGLRPGDVVFGTGSGAFAELAKARADKLALAPANLSMVEAAAVPTSACTALQALRDTAKLKAGQHVLVIGAAGGVGSFAVQLAKAFGAKVTGVCSTRKVELVRSLGADTVVDYTRESLGRGYDLIIDTAGNRSLKELRAAMTPAGTLVIVGGEGGGRWFGGIDRQMRASMLSGFAKQRMRTLLGLTKRADLEVLKGFIESGQLRPVVDRVYPLAQVSDAIRAWTTSHATGKVVIRVTDAPA
jgi:NADPH:quinone reductase-like Zn-dependent oxidoreductase